MKKLKTLSGLLCLSFALVAFTFTSCDDDENVKKELKFTPSNKVEVAAGQVATVTVSNGTTPFTLTPGDVKIATATVDKSTITLTGVEKGTTTITITDKENANGKIAVTVTEAKGLDLDKKTLEVAVNAEQVVTITGGTTPYMVKSKDTAIATAAVTDNKVTIKGLKAGTTTITVSDKEMKKSGLVIVTVK